MAEREAGVVICSLNPFVGYLSSWCYSIALLAELSGKEVGLSFAVCFGVSCMLFIFCLCISSHPVSPTKFSFFFAYICSFSFPLFTCYVNNFMIHCVCEAESCE